VNQLKLLIGADNAPGIGWGGYFQNLLELAKKCDAARDRLCAAQRKMIERSLDKDSNRAARSEDGRIYRMQQEIRHSIQEDVD
jgi:hypothetical protein